MTSTYTPRNRLGMQADGDNTNTYGDVFNAQVTTILDAALDGWAYLTPTTNLTLSTANGTADQARCRGLKYQSGASAVTTTLPAIEKLYLVWNASANAQAFVSSGGGTSATIQPGEVAWIACDATNVVRTQLLTMSSQRLQNVATGTASTDAVNLGQMNAAISSAVFTQTTFGVPITSGNAGLFLTNNGSTPSWGYSVTQGAGLAMVTNNVVTVPDAQAADVLAGVTTNKAMTPGDTYNAFAEVPLYINGSNQLVTGSTAGSALDMSAFLKAGITLNGNVTLPNPTNPKVGQQGRIRLTQDGTGSRTLSYGTYWKRQGGPAVLTTTANATDILVYEVISSTYILYDLKANPS